MIFARRRRVCSGDSNRLGTASLGAKPRLANLSDCGDGGVRLYINRQKHDCASSETQARLSQGLLGGIGFIGGAILKEGVSVRGLATASIIWCTGAISAAVGFERVEIGIVLSLITFLTLRLLTPVEHDDYDNGENNKNKNAENESEK